MSTVASPNKKRNENVMFSTDFAFFEIDYSSLGQVDDNGRQYLHSNFRFTAYTHTQKVWFKSISYKKNEEKLFRMKRHTLARLYLNNENIYENNPMITQPFE